MSDMEKMDCIILAGGKSSRLGFDKKLLELDGDALISGIFEKLRDRFDRFILVSNEPVEKLPDGRFTVVQDERPGMGPMAGIQAGLRASGSEWCLVMGCDMPFVGAELAGELADAATPETDAIIPLSANGIEPLLALYSQRCLPVIDLLLDEDKRRITFLLERVRVAYHDAKRWEEGAGPSSFFNINTPEDLRAARENYHVIKHKGSEAPSQEESLVPAERTITVYAGGEELASLLATPEHVEELAAGFLFSEGLLKDRKEVRHVDVDGDGNAWVDCRPLDASVERRTVITSGCGKGITFRADLDSLRALPNGTRYPAASIHALFKAMREQAETYHESGGMHSAALGDALGLVVSREDIGRHNAVDKVLGHAFLHGVPFADKMLIATGRISSEMAIKAVRAGIPLVASLTSPTDASIEVAKKYGLTLIGYVRAGKMTVYAGAERVEFEEQ